MKSICILSSSSLLDSRARRTAKCMAKMAEVDYYFQASSMDGMSIDDAVNLYPVKPMQGLLSRILDHSFYYLNSRYLLEGVLKNNKAYDIIYSHDLNTSYAASMLSKKFGAKIIYDVHDLNIETINQQFPFTTSPVKGWIFRLIMRIMKYLGQRWEKKFIRTVDLVLTTNTDYAQYLDSRYNVAKLIITPNYPEYREVAQSRSLYEHFGLSDNANIILYHGALTRGRYMELIVESAKYYSSNTYLVIIGNGPLEELLRQYVERNELTLKVLFMDFLNYEELFYNVASATIGLMLISHINLSKKYASANKVTEYMASGVPVIASESPGNRRIIEEAGCGFLKDFSTPIELGNFINELTKDKKQLAAMGLRGKKAFKERYNWNVHEHVFEDAFEKLIS